MAVVVAGVILPIALAGLWIAKSARRSGEEELRTRALQSLTDVARAIGDRWVDQRSALLQLGEHGAKPSVIARAPDSTPLNPSIARDWEALDGVADEVALVDPSGKTHWSLRRRDTGSLPTVRVRVPIFDSRTGINLGWLDARLRLAAVLPSGFLWSGIGGSIPAVFEPGSGTSMLPTPMPSVLLERGSFQWGGEQWLVARRTLTEPPLQLVLAAPTGPFVAPFASAARQAGLALAAAFLVSLVLAMWLTRRLTKPLLQLSTAAGAVAGGELEQRVEEDGPSELRRLARAFNAMTDSLRRTLAELSHRDALVVAGEFAASLAHEVRNPLTSMRLDLERARERLADTRRADGLLSQALQQIDRLDAVVSSALRIARSGQLKLESIDLSEPLASAVHAAQPAFDRRGACLVSQLPPLGDMRIDGNSAALEQLFLNVLLNAAESLPAGGRAEVTVEAQRDSWVVRVRDEGVGIPAEQLSRVLEPFFTTKETGTGLGLTVARRTAEAHGGRISLQSAVGVGTTVEIQLPFRRSIRLRHVS